MTQMSLGTSMARDRAPLLPTEGSGSRRIRSLDGMRGLAALTVLIDHCLITNQNFWQYIGLHTPPNHHYMCIRDSHR